ncbi:MAG: hypothetical protein LPK20_05075, partial [Halomonas sp.]|nr:hypothetical protein [Halomonas sp.]
AMFLNSGKPVLSASSLNFDFPYYKDNQDRLNRILYERKEKRLSRIISKLFSDSEFEHDRVEAEIKRLEKSIMAAWSKAGTLR